MFYSALVSQSSPRRLRVCHFKKGTEICQYSYSNTILAVKLNRWDGGVEGEGDMSVQQRYPSGQTEQVRGGAEGEGDMSVQLPGW